MFGRMGYQVPLMMLAVLGISANVNALEALPDPTRPPGVGTSPAFGEEPSKAPPPVPVLQSIMLSSKRSAAIISGQTVVLGGRFGEYRLVKLSHSEAVLKGESDTQVLKLFPDVEKKIRSVSDETMQAKKNKAGNKPVKKDER